MRKCHVLTKFDNFTEYFLDNGAKTPRKNVAKKKFNRKNAAWNDHHQEPNKINLFWKKIKSTIIMYLGTLKYVVWDEIVAWVYHSLSLVRGN